MSQPIFHAPGHDHERCTADALAHAEALCAERAQRLTPIRRGVLEVLLASHKPLGAYEIIERAASSARPCCALTRPRRGCRCSRRGTG
jgi:Fur family zinc uptake transcriptional regulator